MLNNFEARVNEDFVRLVMRAADYKQSYYGAAYSTRLEQAIEDLEVAIYAAKCILAEDKA